MFKVFLNVVIVSWRYSRAYVNCIKRIYDDDDDDELKQSDRLQDRSVQSD